MTDYKPGDKIRALQSHDPGYQFTAGQVYEVAFVSYGTVHVTTDDKGAANGWQARFFEPVVDEEYESLRKTLIDLRSDLEKRFYGVMAQAEAATPGIEALRDELEELEGRRNNLMDQANRYDAQLTAIERILTEGDRNEA